MARQVRQPQPLRRNDVDQPIEPKDLLKESQSVCSETEAITRPGLLTSRSNSPKPYAIVPDRFCPKGFSTIIATKVPDSQIPGVRLERRKECSDAA